MKKKEIFSNDMLNLKKKCNAIKRAINIKEKDIGENMQLIQSKQDLSYMVKCNVWKKNVMKMK